MVTARALSPAATRPEHPFWAAARAALDGLPASRGLNIAYEAVDRHVAHGRGDVVAIRWRGKRGERRDISYAQLASESSRFANILSNFGLAAGDRVFLLLGRVPALYAAVLGALKSKMMVCPLFSAFGPEPVQQRMIIGSGRILVTSRALYERKVAPIRSSLAELKAVLLIDDDATHVPEDNVFSLRILMDEVSDEFEIPPTDPEDGALLHFTSGTTGTPKGVVHVHGAVVAHHATGAYVLDLRREDVFWCTADPGWVTGTSYGIVSPLTHGVTRLVDEADFDAERWHDLLANEKVTVWYTAPTAIRMLMRAGSELARARDLSALRVIASVGEPLNPEAIVWGKRTYGHYILDNWWQTETGGIMIANRA
jgi:acetyl-CoA synthetase